MNADFSNDRERPASPSPVLENKPLLPTPEEEVKPKYVGHFSFFNTLCIDYVCEIQLWFAELGDRKSKHGYTRTKKKKNKTLTFYTRLKGASIVTADPWRMILVSENKINKKITFEFSCVSVMVFTCVESEGRDPNSGTLLDRLRRDSLTKMQEQPADYKRVYSDWKPTIDKTDVMGTMEAIAGI